MLVNTRIRAPFVEDFDKYKYRGRVNFVSGGRTRDVMKRCRQCLPLLVDTVYMTKDRLLECALGMVADEGVGSLSLRAIAKAAGVSHGAPLRHFPSRAALLSAVAVEG